MNQKVLRLFGHVLERMAGRVHLYRMATMVLMAGVKVGYGVSEVRSDGGRELGLGQQCDDGGGCSTISKR